MRMIMRHAIVCVTCEAVLGQGPDEDPTRFVPSIAYDLAWNALIDHEHAIGHLQARLEIRFALVADEDPFIGGA